MKRIVARFYRTDAGNEPVRTWLLSLDTDDRRTVGKDIATVEFGWPVGMPVCRPLREGLFEVRSTIRSGKVEARTYFAIEQGTMLLLHGADGKQRQDDAISLAAERLRDYRRRGATKR
ncbi:MAG: type II toxin-antitoxin system RelE/ParE family toxin [Rhizobiaceae bacterium]|nr:type II toxin-antitoxin system RelE/ParE family toxin [Rhizobiaceae bacterium]MCV0405556.1 type II toxin-antitoxin system RelE/ParE family toxin [Rhizobiaceae bacterium]